MKNKTKEDIFKFQKEIRKHTTTAIAAAFALTLALTWNSTIRSVVDSFVKRLQISETAYFYEIIIALIVTVICIIGIMTASRYSIKKAK